MNTDLFNFNGQQLRHIMIEGEPWFVGPDVCRILGLKPSPSTGAFNNHYRKLDKGELRSTYSSDEKGKSRGRVMGMVSESGLYKLIMRSDKPEAIAFQNWVTKEVLPAIRRTGGYLLRT